MQKCMLFCSAGLLVTVDLWRRIRDIPNRTVTLVWKTVSLHIQHYSDLRIFTMHGTLYHVWYSYCYWLKCIAAILAIYFWNVFINISNFFFFCCKKKIFIQAIFTLPQVSSDSESYIEAYEVCVSNSNPQRSVCRNVTQTKAELPLDIHKCDITVRAVTQSGLSIPSHITIPSAYTGDKLNAQC